MTYCTEIGYICICTGAGGVWHIIRDKLQEGCAESREWGLQDLDRKSDNEIAEDTASRELNEQETNGLTSESEKYIYNKIYYLFSLLLNFILFIYFKIFIYYLSLVSWSRETGASSETGVAMGVPAW